MPVSLTEVQDLGNSALQSGLALSTIFGMSYNGYSKLNHTYSPYYQQAPGQDGRTPYTDHARGNKGYQSNSYQPLSAYQNSHSQQSAPAQSSNAGMAYNDTGYGGGPSSGGQDSRAAYSNSRSSVDTTALGNLAYASSLGRDNTDLQQTMSYNRSQNPASYSMPSSYGINHSNTLQYGGDHQRRDSTASPATAREDLRVRPSISSPSLGYPPDSGNTGYQSPQIQAGPAQAQYTGTNYGEPYQASQYSNPSRPASGQAVHRPSTITGSQAASPVVAPDPNPRLHSDGNYRRVSTGGRPEKPRVSTPQQQSYGGTSAGPQAGNFTKNSQPKKAASSSAPIKATRIATPTSANNTASQPSNGFRKSTDHQSNDHVSQRSTPTNPQFPTTVNPSQVFNDAEYQRRQAAAATEAENTRKKAEDVRATALPKDTSPSIPPSAGTDVDAAKKEQMELEMKQMIEKMRDYKSKDPSLFSQIWEQVKKGQPAQRTSQVVAHESSASPVVMNDQAPNPLVQLPPESELSAADGESLPPNFDRGRFPAQRRRRGGATYTPEKKQATPKGSAKSASAKSNVEGNQPMQKAVRDSHRKSDSSMPPAQTTNRSVGHQVEELQSQATPTSIPASTSGLSAIPTPSATSKAQAKPPTPKAYGTYWPEHKKKQLADAARVALTTTPQNTGKEITPDEIHKLLDQNPSYIQLCEILENRGFVIDRGQFARLLLSAVPDLAQGSSPRSPAASSSHHGLPTPSTAPPQGGLSATSKPNSIPPNQQTNRYVTPYGIPNQPGNHPAPQAQMTPASGPSRDYRYMDPSNPMSIDKRRQYPVAPPPPSMYNSHGVLYPTGPIPPSPQSDHSSARNHVRWQNRPATSVQPAFSTKQDLARKRSFGEIVDLTQAMSEDEDNEPPSQRPRVDDTTLKVYTAGRSVNSGTATPSSVKDTTNLEEFRHKPTGKEAYLRAPNIISPMNKRQDALRRSSYNPKTISRDVLLAVGKHPTMAPLNSHLDVLRDRFTAVNNDSDLSTFRWDLVDPGGPPPVQHTTVDEVSHQSRRSSGKHVRPRIAVVVGGSGPIEVEPGKCNVFNTGLITDILLQVKVGAGIQPSNLPEEDVLLLAVAQNLPPFPTQSTQRRPRKTLLAPRVALHGPVSATQASRGSYTTIFR